MNSSEVLQNTTLPSLPEYVAFLLNLEASPDSGWVQAFMRFVSRDSGLEKFFSLVSASDWYFPAGSSLDIETALERLGEETTTELSLAYFVASLYTQQAENQAAAEIQLFLIKRTIATASLNRFLAAESGGINKKGMTAAAMLIELGSFILLSSYPDKYCEFFRKQWSAGERFANEQAAFGISGLVLFKKFCTGPGGVCAGNPDFSEVTEYVLGLSAVTDRVVSGEVKKKNKTFDLADICLGATCFSADRVARGLASLQENISALWPELTAQGELWPEMFEKAGIELLRCVRAGESINGHAVPDSDLSARLMRVGGFFVNLTPPANIVKILLSFSERHLFGAELGIVRKNTNEPGWRFFSENRNTIRVKSDMPLLAGMGGSFKPGGAVKIPEQQSGDFGLDSKKSGWIVPIFSAQKPYGFLLLAKENPADLSRAETDSLVFLSGVMGMALAGQNCYEKYRAEKSKNELLRKELLKTDTRLEEARREKIKLQKIAVFPEALPAVFHKLKNKLTPVMGYAQMLGSRSEDEFMQKRLQKIENSAEALAELLNRLRNYFPAVKTMKERVSLNQVIRGLEPELNSMAGCCHVRLKLELDDALPEDNLNYGQIEVLLVQLMSNALKAIDLRENSEGKVTVETRKLSGENYRLRFGDNGAGIPESDREKVWMPFFSGFKDSNGLGLTVCDRIIGNHGASRRILSSAGENTWIEVCFSSREPETAESGILNLKKSINRKRVLLVDDEKYLVDLMREILGEMECLEVHSTTSGRQALEWLEEETFDLIVSDVCLNDASGFDIFNTLESLNRGDRLLLVSSDFSSIEIRGFIEKNNISIITKPFELMDFKRLVLEKLSEGGMNA